MKTISELAEQYKQSKSNVSRIIKALNISGHRQGRYVFIDSQGQQRLEEYFKPKKPKQKRRMTEGARMALLPYEYIERVR